MLHYSGESLVSDPSGKVSGKAWGRVWVSLFSCTADF